MTGTSGLLDLGNTQIAVYGGAVHTTGAPLGKSHIRKQLAQAGTAVTFDWSATPIKAVTITVVDDSAETTLLMSSLDYCIDPPTSGIRDAWLTDATSIAADINHLTIKAGETVTHVFTDVDGNPVGVDYIGFVQREGGGTLRVTMEGIAL